MVEAAEAISRGVELQPQRLEDACFILKNDHDYVSQGLQVFKGSVQSQEEATIDTNSSSKPVLPTDSDQYETKFTLNNPDSEGEEEEICNKDIKVKQETESDTESGQDVLTDTAEIKTEKDNSFLSTDITGQQLLLTKGKEIELFKCDKCNYSTTVKYYLKDHIKNMHSQNPVKCPVCTRVFANMRSLKKHQLTHDDSCSLCETCGKLFKCQKAFKTHSKTHEKDFVRNIFKCNECEKMFSSNFNLISHNKSEHAGVKKNFLCQTCGKSFTSKNTMLQHLNVHTGKRPYVCKQCGKDFSYESALRDHKNIHEKNKSYVCDFPECKKTFYQRSALKIHRAIHKGSKDFVCNDCGRGFTQKQALQRHERSHTGLKPFRCVYCSRTFGDPSVIRRHIQLVHKVNKDTNVWREDIVELSAEELKALEGEPSKQISDILPKAPAVPSQLKNVVQMNTSTQGRENSSIIEQDTTPVSQLVNVDDAMTGVSSDILNKSPSAKFLIMTGDPVQGTLLNCQYPIPNQATFLLRPSAVIQVSKPYNTENTQFVHEDTSEKETVQFFNENLDGTFSSVADTTQKEKTYDSYLRPNPILDIAVTSEQSLEQLKPDGTIAETGISLSDEGVGDSELTNESLTQFYSYYTSLTGHLAIQDPTPVKPE